MKTTITSMGSTMFQKKKMKKVKTKPQNYKNIIKEELIQKVLEVPKQKEKLKVINNKELK